MTTQASKTVVILQDSKDWAKWIDIIKTASEKYDLWKHINPETPATTLPALIEPLRPTPSTVLWPPPLRNPAIPAGATPESAPTRYSELDNDQREALRTLNEEYNRDIKRYNKKVKASADLKSKIQESVHKDNFEYTTNCASVWEILCKLKARFAPTDKAKELEVITDWQKVTKKPEQSTDIKH
jgi:oligoribonuclease NrnB/cAMP/cGMP phosphodiesterase (DHH superfamily)